MTRADLQGRVWQVARQKISLETIRNMERERPCYGLPRRRSTGELPLIVCIAKALGVPLGYLLGGFSKSQLESSCFSTQIHNGSIIPTDALRQEGGIGRLTDFLKTLPDSEKELLTLPLHSYRNERAFAVIFRIERIFSGLEMLIVNEPPLLFWDDEDVDFWSQNMGIDDVDSDVFKAEFREYGEHFRGLARRRAKKYRIVLNRPTFVKWLKRKARQNRRLQLDLMVEFVQMPNCEILFLNLQEKSAKAIDEKEVICKFQEIPDTMVDTLAIQILQTPPDHRPVEYFLTPIPPNKFLLQTEKSNIDLAWAAALDEARQSLHGVTSTTRIADISLEVLQKIRVVVDAV